MSAQNTAVDPVATLSPGQKAIYQSLRKNQGAEYAECWAARLTSPQADEHPPLDAPEPLRRPAEAPKPIPLPPDPLRASERLTRTLEKNLHPRALRIYRVLIAVCLQVAAERQYVDGTTSVAIHLPTELLAFELGIARNTLMKYVNELKQAGLVDQRGHNSRFGVATRKSGSVWRVKLNPDRGGRVRLTHDDLAHPWRNLEADVHARRTVFRWIQEEREARKQKVEQSNGEENLGGVRTQALLQWALKPGNLEYQTPLTVQNQKADAPYALLDAVHAPLNEREHAVEEAARALAGHLQDPSIAFYRKLVWDLLQLFDKGEDRVSAVYHMLVRAGVDAKEGFAKRPGALFTARLKESGILKWLRRPQYPPTGELTVAA